MTDTLAPEAKQFPCGQCGASLKFAPGTAVLKCPYCGHDNPIPQSDDDIVELDFHAYLQQLDQQPDTIEVMTTRCDGCGAEVDPPPDATAFDCPFCGHAINTQARSRRLIKPRSLLPFAVTRDRGRELFKKWLASLWFAPSKLKQYARKEGKLNGVYVPYWTYDADTTSHYTGQRGDHYWVTQTYTVRVNGKTQTRTRQVRKTRWTYASGTVWRSFDDVLVLASGSLPRSMTERLEPWDLHNLTAFDEAYLAGFRAETYQVDLEGGFVKAKDIMAGVIRGDVRSDIGGDEQRIHSVKTRHDHITFKHLLLPIWISAYRWKDKVYRFVINGRTGEVQGQRPWSFWKITAAVLAVLAAVGGAAAVVMAVNA